MEPIVQEGPTKRIRLKKISKTSNEWNEQRRLIAQNPSIVMLPIITTLIAAWRIECECVVIARFANA